MKRLLAIAALLAAPAAAGELALPPGARSLSVRETPLGSYALPLGAVQGETVPSERREGRILRRTWRLRGDATVLQVLAPLRAQLEAAGFSILFQCAARECGGFDFRFAIEVVPAPDMAVDISDYQFLSAARDASAVSLLVSRSGNSAYLQMIEVLPPGAGPLTGVVPPEPEADEPEEAEAEQADAGMPQPAALAAELLGSGHVILEGLQFETGSDALGEGVIESLAALARFLADNPQYSVLLVGHTDAVGGLDANIALSRQRAASVKDRLVSAHGIPDARIAVAGAGYLAPRASNLTAGGREANRRVEAVLTAN